MELERGSAAGAGAPECGGGWRRERGMDAKGGERRKERGGSAGRKARRGGRGGSADAEGKIRTRRIFAASETRGVS